MVNFSSHVLTHIKFSYLRNSLEQLWASIFQIFYYRSPEECSSSLPHEMEMRDTHVVVGRKFMLSRSFSELFLLSKSLVSIILYLGLFTQQYLLNTCPVLDTGHSEIKWYSVCPNRSHGLVVRAPPGTVSKFNIEQHLLPPRTICRRSYGRIKEISWVKPRI